MKRMSYEKLIKYYNSFLEKNNQIIRIVRLNKFELVLNNKKIIVDYKERVNFFNRCKSNFLGDKIDFIYNFSNDKEVKKIISKVKKEISSNAGKKCQNLHGEFIKNNLNNGVPWNKGLKGDERCIPWNKGLTKENNKTLKNISIQRSGNGNPMYGFKYSEEYKKQKSKMMKDKILNGDFTPNIHNSKTHWQVKYNGKKYRSSWEAVFHYLNPYCEYEKVRISYFFEGKNKVYISDFVDNLNKKLYEIKPKEQLTNKKIKAKEKAAIEWCKQNGFVFQNISQNYFIENIDKIKKSDLNIEIKNKMEKLYEINKKNRN